MEQALTHDTWGIARYSGDTYYYTSPYSPAGNEAGSAEPVWPNMTMLVALYEIYTGRLSDALSRLQWYASVSGVGYMPPGEAVSWTTDQPIVSTMSEPFTAASFIMTALTYTGQYDPRVYATGANASAYATVNETTSPATDWPNWRSIPYYDGNPAGSASGSKMTDITRVYLSNDSNYLYVRIDNASGSLSAYNTSPLFGAFVYAQDFDHSGSVAATSSGYYNGTLDHPMNYMVGRWSNSSTFSQFSANSSGGWNFGQNLGGLAPQWDTAAGRIELKIPLSALASGSTSAGQWSYLDVELAYQNPSTGTWSDDDITGIHYELASAGQAWQYGSTLGHELLNVTTSAARYAPGTQVPVEIQMVNPQAVSQSGQTLSLVFTHLGAQVGPAQTVEVPTLAPGQTATEIYDWSPPDTDHQGYLVQVTLADSGGHTLGTGQTAVDVSSDYTKFPRYGFVTNYSDNYQSPLVANELNDFHINVVQFYDWEWKHHVPLAGTVSAPASSWIDIGGDTNYQHTVMDLLNAIHGKTMAGLSYNLIYGAWAGYGQDGSGVNYQWGLWWNNNCTNQVNIALSGLQTSNLYVFDPGNTSWQSYIFGREKDAFSVYPFDGWQADQLGNQGTTYTCGGTVVNPADEFNGFLTNAASSLGKAIVFNAVGQYGQQQIAANPNLAFLYTEAWPANGQTTYDDLQNVVHNNDTWSSNTKATVIAAYLDQAYSQNYSDSSRQCGW